MKNEKHMLHHSDLRIIKNRGFSLIEMIVVIAILGILASGAVMSVGMLNSANVSKGAGAVDSILTEVRMDTMCKEAKPYLYVYMLNDNIYMKVSISDTASGASLTADSGRLVLRNGSFSYKRSTESETSMTNGGAIRVGFLRSSGAFDTKYEYMKLAGKSRNAIIRCTAETGRHNVE